MDKHTKESYTDNRIGSGHYCECGKELKHSEYNNQRYQKYKTCSKCMNNYCDHAITGE